MEFRARRSQAVRLSLGGVAGSHEVGAPTLGRLIPQGPECCILGRLNICLPLCEGFKPDDGHAFRHLTKPRRDLPSTRNKFTTVRCNYRSDCCAKFLVSNWVRYFELCDQIDRRRITLCNRVACCHREDAHSNNGYFSYFLLYSPSPVRGDNTSIRVQNTL